MLQRKNMMTRKTVEHNKNSLKRMKSFMLSQNAYQQFHLSTSNVEEVSYIYIHNTATIHNM